MQEVQTYGRAKVIESPTNITYHVPSGMSEKGLTGLIQKHHAKQVLNFLNHKTTSNMATKKAAPKKAAKAVKKVVKKEGGPGLIEQIIELHKKGLTNKEIEAKGFNKTTIGIQVAKYKRNKAAKKAAK